MTDMLARVEQTPRWLRLICTEIDKLAFGEGFELFQTDAVLYFGVERIQGRDAMCAFFVKIDSPLIIEHRVLETWQGQQIVFVRGEADMAKRTELGSEITAPYMWKFVRTGDGPSSISEWRVTAGPLRTDAVM